MGLISYRKRASLNSLLNRDIRYWRRTVVYPIDVFTDLLDIQGAEAPQEYLRRSTDQFFLTAF